jgi:drug/metabolite transporter (DMT)-like permease
VAVFHILNCDMEWAHLSGGFRMSLRNSWLATRFDAVPPNAKGLANMLASATTISGVNGLVVHLSHSVHVFEIAFFRQLFGVIFMSALFLRGGLRPLITRRFGLHVLRSVLNVVAMLGFFYGLTLEPLAKVVSLSLSAPLFATVGAVLFLREKMTPHRWVALLVGFAGGLIILRPGIQVVSIGAIMVVLSNAFWAVALVVIKVLSRTESSVTIALYATILQTPVALIFALFFWQTPTFEQLVWMAAIGIGGTVAQICLGEAFRHADATLVLPIDFTKLFWASLIGYFFFDQVPEIWIWVGGAVVFAAVFYNTYEDRGAAP